jgi:hypothetical protein
MYATIYVYVPIRMPSRVFLSLDFRSLPLNIVQYQIWATTLSRSNRCSPDPTVDALAITSHDLRHLPV